MYEKEIEIAKKAILQAGLVLNKRENISVDSEVEKDIKLNADKMAESIIIEELRGMQYDILSEEYGLLEGNNHEYCWIIDPLDGTANYFRGLDELCCVSIALWKDNKPVFGVINRFTKSDIYVGVIGVGAWKNETPICVSTVENVPSAVLATGFPVKMNYSTENVERYVKRVQCFKKVRMLGTAAMMGTFVAEGKIDTYIEEEIMLWDIAASTAIVIAAGGTSEVTMLEDNKCVCKLFANERLKEDYYANCL